MIPYLWLIPLGILVAAAGWMWWEIRHAPLCDREGNPIDDDDDPEPEDPRTIAFTMPDERFRAFSQKALRDLKKAEKMRQALKTPGIIGPDPESDPDPDDEYHCLAGCGRTMERIQLHKGTPETGYTALKCSKCGRVEY